MRYVIIGGSAAGINAIEAIRSVDPKGKITLVSDEQDSLYSRCLITYYLAGAIPEEKLKYRAEDFFAKHNVETVLGEKVKKVNGKDKTVKLTNGKAVSFDKLLIAAGASPKMMERLRDGEMVRKRVLGIRGIEDIRNIKRLLNNVKTVAILGGGLIGLRAAYALNACGKDVKVIVKSNRVLSQMLDEGGAALIQKRIEEKGIEVMTGVAVKEVVGDKAVTGLILDNGEKLDCQLVIVGKGVSPNIDLVNKKEIKTDWGILVNDYLQTSLSDIYAAGDCAQSKDLLTGESTINALWPCAVQQGKIAGLNMAGKRKQYQGSMAMNSVEFFGLPTISLGITRPRGEGYEVLSKKVASKDQYKKMVLRDNRIVGVVLVGDIDKAGIYGSLMQKKVDVSLIKQWLLDDNFNFAKILPVIGENKDRFAEKAYQSYVLT
ncbi:NAD(P)/FAD-dependent oxidoreductase [Candidatus Margulisiibacteriota bacterium]